MQQLQGAVGVVEFSSYVQEDGALKKGLKARAPETWGRSIPPQKPSCGYISKETPEQEVGLQVAAAKATPLCHTLKSTSCFVSFNPTTRSLE